MEFKNSSPLGPPGMEIMRPEKIPILNLVQLSKTFPQNPVISRFSKTAHAGEKILLRGNNGSGKTTLLRIIAGLIDPDLGHVLIAGQSFQAKTHNQLISWLPVCESGFWGRLTVLEGLSLYAKLWKVSDKSFHQQIESWKKLPAFVEVLNQQIFKLSTGRRQLLHFCRLLLHQPKIILMDEPFRSLDIDTLLFIEKQFIHWTPSAVVIWSSPHPIASDNKFFHDTVWTLSSGPQ